MPNFKFGQQVVGNVFSLHDRDVGGGARRNRTKVSAGYTSPGSSTPNAMNSVPMGSSGYQVNRFNPAYDRLEEGSVIEDWIPRDLPGINKLLRILYTRDSIAGPAVDIMANLPWSEFDLQGIEDPAIMRFFEDASQLFGDKAQEMAAITTEYLVLGRFCASLIYDESKGYWNDFVPHDSDFLTITPIPVRNFDPKIDLVLSPGVRQFVNSQDYRDVAALGHLPKHLIDKMRSGTPIPLDPLNTLYIRRKCSPYDFVGTSLYTRIIPYWAMEKSLMNATVVASRRRAGNILHVTAGLDDRWEPTQQEMEDLAGLFIQADEDPVGAVVVTRTGVQGQEIRQGGQIWKWSDEWATFSEGKMRGLGISEALLSGDATYNNAENARSVFTEQVRTLRSFLTQQVYYRRFKVLARAHGFRKRKKADLDHRVRTEEPKADKPDLSKDPPQVKIQPYDDINIKNLNQDEALDIPEGDLIVPTMHWHKSLLPEGDKEYLDLLNQLKEQGVPVPLKVWAARGGYDMDEALKMLDEDLELRKKVGKWRQQVEGGGEGGDAEGEADGDSGPFWDPGERFLELQRGEAKTALQELVNVVNQPGKQEVLADTDFVQRTCYAIVKNQRKLELLNYVLMRLGVVKNLPISAETIKDIADFLAKSERYSTRRRMQELQFLSMVARSPDSKPNQVDVEKIAAKTLRVISRRNEPLADKIEEANKSPDLAPTAPTFLSGAK